MDLNRREVLKSGAAGFLLGFLFRGRNGKLSEQAEVVEQPPSAITIRTVPQQAFRPSRLIIAGTVVGKRLVPEMRFVPCPACDGQHEDEYQYKDDEHYCEVCDDLGGKLIETGKMIERDVTRVPWTIDSLSIGSKDQFASAGTIPGDMFSTEAIDNFMGLAAAREGQEIEIVVRYTGDKPGGEVFHATLIGTSIDSNGVPRQAILPISSVQKIIA
jgi:hypothetical protein